MIRINLLPFRAARKKENIRRQISVFALCLIFVIIVAIYWNIRLGNQITDLKTRVAATKKEVAKYTKITKQIARIKKQLKLLKQKTRIIKVLERNRFEPVKLLDTMSDKVVAKRMWFSGFQEKGKKVNINGIALDNRTVADFMTRLQGTGLFQSVKLKKIQKHVIKGAKLKKFQVSCTKKSSEKPKKKKKPRGKRKK
jgi:type IV pilus assembly protein PilN